MIQSQKVKENIILKNADAQNTFVFQFKINGLELKEEEDGRILFIDGKGKTIFEIPKPFAYDADVEHTDKVSFSLVKGKGKKSELTLTVDEEWLKAEERKFPVVIDPLVQSNQDANSIQDAYVLSGYPDTNYYLRNILKTGVDATAGAARSFIRFDLPKLKAGDMVVSAALRMCNYIDGTSPITVGAYDASDTNWSSSTITWNNMPQCEIFLEDYATFTQKLGETISFDITNMVKSWYENNYNGGVMLKSLQEDGQYAEFVSSDYSIEAMDARPTVFISYINNNGLEGYWTYHQQDAGRAGTGHVNDYNGNLVFIHPSAKTSGSRMPVAVNHIYNSNDKDTDLGYGYGWRLNYLQTIKQITISSETCYQYVDEDGTSHYFRKDKNDNKWKDDSGIDLELTINSSDTDKYVVNDKQDNKLIFDTAGNRNQILL